MIDMDSFINTLNSNQGVLALLFGLIGLFGLKQISRRTTNASNKKQVGNLNIRDIKAGKDVIINNGTKRKKTRVKDKTSKVLVDEWSAKVIGSEWKVLNLPIQADKIIDLSANVQVLTPGQIRWRAGFYFENVNSGKEYIFHVYQDLDSDQFRSRIVEKVNGMELPDIAKEKLGIQNPRKFTISVKNQRNILSFYVDDIFLGKYEVPLRSITNVSIAAWSDENPIEVLFNNVSLL